ncbi:hypothetical protein MANES_13G153300v8 [Manihot esculenta]|uniref:Uncharacterized protein n=1 Tax=Manihot esculenta TaxID=3983 RepID=A0A2C9UU42_MANES|nr:hypothetical protein MANES_13G153300v8 [Manihot esculenta]
MVSADEFSFPKITNTLPRIPISPSLWRVSSIVYPEDEGEDANEEEKMDMLWEDFNEELQRVSSSSKNKQSSGYTQDLQLCSVQALTMSKPDRVYQPKKQSAVLLIKVLKKIFLLQKSAQIKNN